MKAILIAGTASGVGKTTIACGLMAAWTRRGKRVQPFKVGPDYIDPTYHSMAAGRPSRSLDSWLLDTDVLRDLFSRAAAGCDVAVIEGVMGLYDGRSGAGEVGSTAHVAKLLGIPTVLVVDVAKAARSSAAVVLGFRSLDPELSLAGVILNNVASEAHLAAVAEPIEREAGVSVLGWLPREPRAHLTERYLGLVPTAERPVDPAWLDRIVSAVAAHVDLDRLLEIAGRAGTRATRSNLFPPQPLPRRVRLAVARDEAFHFYYQDNLDLLQAWGARIEPFSPLQDGRLPDDVDGIYVGGGFPELYAAELASNRPLLAGVRRAASAGMPIYAECGGLMWLAEGLTDGKGQRHQMAGVIPGWSTMQRGKLTLGYREVRARSGTILLEAGEQVRGHEFHWSTWQLPAPEHAAYEVVGTNGRVEGFAGANILASYVHLHFGADARLAPRLVEACARFANQARREPRSRGAVPPVATGTARASFDGGRSTGSVQRSGGADSIERRERADERLSTCATTAVPPDGSLLRAYGLPPSRIEALSQQRIADQLGRRLPREVRARGLVTRLVYAAGDPELADQVVISPEFFEAASGALRQRAAIIVDVRMVAAGLNRRIVPEGCPIVVAIDAVAEAPQLVPDGQTRSAAGILSIGGRLDGSVVAIGNAPTALLALLDLIAAGRARPAAVIGMPVGFVAAVESKDALLDAGVPFATIRGTRGGSPLAAATMNYLLKLCDDELAADG